MLPGNEYIWGAYWGESQVSQSPNLSVTLCQHSRGTFKEAGRLELKTDRNNLGVALTYQVLFKGRLSEPGHAAPDKKGQKRICKGAGSLVGPVITAGLAGVPLTIVQTQASQPRTIEGEMLLTLKSDPEKNQPAPEDVRVWACLVTRGYPSIEFVEQPGDAVQSVFVWPDGRFLAELRGGVDYTLRLLPSQQCGTPMTEIKDKGHLLRGPAVRESSEEKVLLACFVVNKSLSECHPWWLSRPQ